MGWDRADEEGMMSVRLMLIVAIVAAAAGTRAQQPGAPVRSARDVPRITQAVFRAKVAAKEVLILDVRDDVAFRSGHVPGAMHMLVKDAAARAATIRRLAGTRLVVTYCSCAAEQSAADAGLVLLQHGVPRVAALLGGYPDWIHGGGLSETAP